MSVTQIVRPRDFPKTKGSRLVPYERGKGTIIVTVMLVGKELAITIGGMLVQIQPVTSRVDKHWTQ